MNKCYAQKQEDVVELLQSDSKNGITGSEAKRRLAQYGSNVILKRKSKGWLAILAGQFFNPIIWVLILASILAVIFNKNLEGIAIAIVIAINTCIGFLMELQASRSIEALTEMGRSKTKVVRNSTLKEIDSANLVPGDVIFLEAGDMVTADCRLLEVHNLSVMESELTGESFQVEKQVDELPLSTILAEQTNMVFKGTYAVNGNGYAVVIATGAYTELGKISEIAHVAQKEITPLNRRLNELTRQLSWITLGIAFLIFITGVLRGSNWITMIETALALAVAAFPEGLPVIATITLAKGMIKLANRNAVVKTLESVQTLGETNIIFTDKTGTLTKNELQLEHIETPQITVSFQTNNSKQRIENVQLPSIIQFFKIGVLCNDSKPSDGNGWVGDPMDVAIFNAASEIGIEPEEIQNSHKRIDEIPFDASSKMMTTLNEENGLYLVCVKGATEVVLNRCNRMLDEMGNEVNLKDVQHWLQISNTLSASGLRVLGFAYKLCDKIHDKSNLAHNLIFIGVAGFIDDARQGVKEAIKACQSAGVKVIMITGDHPDTARYIAEKVGLVRNLDEVQIIHGRGLSKLFKNEDFVNRIGDIDIFARIDPSQKLELVELYQKHKFIVGMTGDGVNDAPALKKADIGIAMGLRGTEVAKEAADIILKDDSFSSIVLAIRQGRVIFANIQKFVIYLLSCNLSEILVVGTAAFLNIPLPLLPLQILFLNLVTDIFPALAIGLNKGENNVLSFPARNSKDPIIKKEHWYSILTYGLVMTGAVMAMEWVSWNHWKLSKETVNNLAFYTLTLAQLWNVFNIPLANTSFIKNEVTRNKYIWLAILVSITIVFLAWLIVPVRQALSLHVIEPELLIVPLGFSLITVLIIQFLKRGIGIVA